MNILCLILGHKWEKEIKTIYNHGCIPESDTFDYKQCKR